MAEREGLFSSEDLKRKKTEEPKSRNGKRSLLRGALLLGVLLLSVGIYFLSGRTPSPQNPEPTAVPSTAADERVRLIERAREEVAEVQITHGGDSYTVVSGDRDEKTAGEESLPFLKEWPDFQLDQEKVSVLLGYAANLIATRLVTEQAEDLDAYGLAEPAVRVTMRYRDGTETGWRIGNRAPTSTAFYFMKEGEAKVYLLYAAAAETLSARRNDLHPLSMPGKLNADQIRSLAIQGRGQEPLEVGYSKEGTADKAYSISALRIFQPFYYTANAERTLELFQHVAEITIASYAGEMDELQGTGLEREETSLRVTVTQTGAGEDPSETETFDFRIGNRTEDGKSAYLMVDHTNSVYLTAASAVSFLDSAAPAYLVDQFTNLVYIHAVDSVEILAGEERWQLDVTHSESGQDAFRFNGEAVEDASAFRKLYQQLVGMTSSKISENYAWEGDVLLSVHYRLNTEPGELSVEYLAFDENYDAVRRDGLTLFLLKRDQVENLVDALRRFDSSINRRED